MQSTSILFEIRKKVQWWFMNSHDFEGKKNVKGKNNIIIIMTMILVD